MATQLEEIVVNPDTLNNEYSRPDLRKLFFKFGARLATQLTIVLRRLLRRR